MHLLLKHSVMLLATATALLAGLCTSPALAQDWNNPGEGDWFEPLNWTPNAVPDGTDANINNGGTAVLGENAPDVTVRNLNIGVDGGEGMLRFQDSGPIEVTAEQGIRIGVTEAGTAASNGTLSIPDSSSFISLLPGNNSVPFLLGVSTGDGAAIGEAISLDTSRTINLALPSSGPFAITQIGVAEGSGDASGNMIGRTFDFRGVTLLELGVSRGSGSAQGRVQTDQEADRVEGLNVGVATDAGDADGWIRTGKLLRSNTSSGNAQVGVSQGSGRAVGVVDLDRTVTGGQRSFGPFQQLDIGVSNGAGDASGTVLTGNGLSAQTLNLGISNSTGTGTGLIRTDHGFSDFNSMNLGPRATVLLNAGSNVRGSDSNTGEAYGAINAGTALLDGTLIVDFDYIPDGPARFELINSTAANGLEGDFDTVEVRNLNPGLSFTSGVVLDGGVEKYVLDLTGTPSLPEWVNPGADDWFEPTNWSSGTVPDFSQPSLILNGGEARAGASTAPGPLQAFQFGIGVDGGNGSLFVDGVDLETFSNFQVGVIRPDHTSGGHSVGSASIADAELRFSGASSEDEFPPPVATARVTSIGVAYTSGSAAGSLTLDNVNFVLEGLRVGYVDINNEGIDANADADGQLMITGNTQLPGSLRAGQAFVDADGASGTASADVKISDSVIDGFFSIGEVEADGFDSSAAATASVVIADTIFNQSLDFIDIEVDGAESRAVSNVTASLDRVSMLQSELRLAECDAQEPGAQALPSTAVVSVRDSVLGSAGNPSQLDVSEVETDEDGVADCTGRADFVDSELILGSFQIAEGDAEDSSTARATAEVTITGGAVTAERIRIGEADVSDDGVAIVDGRLGLVNTTADSSEEVVVGSYDDDGAATGNTVTARLGLTGSALSTPLLEIGVENPAGHPLDAQVILNPSYLETDFLAVGPDGRLVLFVEGPTAATRDNLDQDGLYAVVDAVDALIEGEVIVRINYPAQRGETFDVLRTGPGALTGSPGTFRVASAPPDAVNLEVVTEDGADVLRATALRNLPPPGAPTGIPVLPPIALVALILLGLLLGLFAVEIQSFCNTRQADSGCSR